MTLKHLATTRLHKFSQTNNIKKTQTESHPRIKRKKSTTQSQDMK